MASRKWTDKEFGKKLKAEREHLGWTQPELAEHLRNTGIQTMHPTTIAKIEAGSRSVRINEAIAFADAFDVSIDALLGRQEPDDTTLTYAMENASSYATRAERELQTPRATASSIEEILEDATARFANPSIKEMVSLARDLSQALNAAAKHCQRIDIQARDLIIRPEGERSQRD